MADADSNDVKMADEASGEQAGVASTESDMECEKVSGTTESDDPLPNVGVTADDRMECDVSSDEIMVQPEEALKSITNTSDVAKDKMECEEIRDEPKCIDTSAEIRDKSKETAEVAAESLAHSEKKDEMECEKVSGTTESGDQLPNVGVTADDKMQCDASADEKMVKPEEALKSITNASDVSRDKMDCEDICDEPKSIDTSAEIREESKETAEVGAESLAHSEKKDEMEFEDVADKLQSEDSKSSLEESELPTDAEEKLAETSNDVSVKVDVLKLADQEKDGKECVSDKLQSEDETARNSSESKSVHVEESAPSNESSNDGLIIGKKTASVDLSEFLGKSYDIRKLPLPYSPSSGELADESNQSVAESLPLTSSERTRVEDVRPVAHIEIIVEDSKPAGLSFSTDSTASSDTRELTNDETTVAAKMSPSTFTSGSELVLAKNESQKSNDSVTQLPKTSTTTNAVASSSASFEPILPEDTKPKELTSDDTISVPVQNLVVELVIMKEAEVAEEPEGAKPVHLSPKKPQTLQTEKHVKDLSAEEEKSETSDAPGFQQEHSNVELPMKQDESAAATPEDVQSDVEEPRSHVGVKRRMNVDEEHFASPSKKVNRKLEECT